MGAKMIDTEMPSNYHVEAYLSDREYRRYATVDEPLRVQAWSDCVTRGIIPAGAFAPKLKLVAESAPQDWFLGIIEQVLTLHSMPENWDGQGASRISPGIASSALNLLFRTMDATSPKPAIVPTACGTIVLEWHGIEYDLEIELTTPSSCQISFREGTSWQDIEELPIQKAAKYILNTKGLR
jgi:hypothetical protein